MEYAVLWSGRCLPAGSAETLTLYYLRCIIRHKTVLCRYQFHNLKSHVQLLVCNMPGKHPTTFYEYDEESSDFIIKNFLISLRTTVCSRNGNVGPRAHPVSCKMSTGAFFPGVKRPGRGVNHPTPSSAEVKERVKL